MDNPVRGIRGESDIRQFLLQRGIDGVLAKAGYVAGKTDAENSDYRFCYRYNWRNYGNVHKVRGSLLLNRDVYRKHRHQYVSRRYAQRIASLRERVGLWYRIKDIERGRICLVYFAMTKGGNLRYER